MGELQKKIDAVMRFATANTVEERNAALEEVRRLLDNPAHAVPDPETIIREILLEIGAPDHLLGHPAVIEAVMIVLEEPRYLQHGICELYEVLGTCFDTTSSNIERTIRFLIEKTWLLGDIDKQTEYFGATIDVNRGKPTNGQFIARLANITSQRLKLA